MSEPLSKTYAPAEHEPRAWERWNAARAFAADPGRVVRGEAEPYAILIPPPNVTAPLHLGHALNNSLQDILVRHHRMLGRETLWMPGTDHAGIATQTVVDRRLKAEGKPALAEYKKKAAAGDGDARDEFVALVQSFKDEYEAVITQQLKAMGCSCDWDRQRFTMDQVCGRAVREAFFRLFRDGLIERGKRLVNWDPVTQTALADDEVEMHEVEGVFAYLRYPLVHPSDRPQDKADHDPVTWGELAARGYPGAAGYPEDDQAFVTVATTRPETYLGDVAVALNPADPRAAALRGLLAELPLVGRRVPVLEDDYVVLPDPESGDTKARMATGFLKVTPAHDPNDYAIGQRHRERIEAVVGRWLINVMAPDASISADFGWDDFDPRGGAEVFVGKTREEARELVLREFRARHVSNGNEPLLERVVPYTHAVGHSYRSHAAIEPYLSDQWYCRVTDDRLVGRAERALSDHQGEPRAHEEDGDGSLTFFPARYAKTYSNWHENLRDWCISRQLWWGHRIPVWSRDAAADTGGMEALASRLQSWEREGRIAAAVDQQHDRPEAEQAGLSSFAVRDPDADREVVGFLEQRGFVQDPDVLDTWFSSALWPLSTMGWPDAERAAADTGIADFSEMLAAFNPSNVLCTAREIITLWVSRMAMFNRYFLGEADAAGRVPFHDVFIHAMIQDGEGRKMSKSLGNGVDPLDIIASHGTDAMRYTLCKMTTQTQDVRMPVERDPATGKNTSPKFDEGRNLCNKLWNAARFTLSLLPDDGGEGGDGEPVDPGSLSLADRWMLSRLAATIETVNAAVAGYEFSEYARAVYDLLWRDFCDWYLEAIKPTVRDTPAQQAVLRHTLDAILRLLHPITPFITEAVFEKLSEKPAAAITGLRLGEPRKGGVIATAPWPGAAALRDAEAETAFEKLRELTEAIRQVRAQQQVKPKRRVTLHATDEIAELIGTGAGLVETLAGLATVTTAAPSGLSSPLPFAGLELRLSDLADEAEAAAAGERLTGLAEALRKEIATLEGRLANPGYTQKAPPKLVEETRGQLARKQQELAALERE